MAAAPKNPNPPQKQNVTVPPPPRGRANPAANLGAHASQAAQQAVGTAKDVYGAASALVPGVMLRRGLEKAKGALQKITKR